MGVPDGCILLASRGFDIIYQLPNIKGLERDTFLMDLVFSCDQWAMTVLILTVIMLYVDPLYFIYGVIVKNLQFYPSYDGKELIRIPMSSIQRKQMSLK